MLRKSITLSGAIVALAVAAGSPAIAARAEPSEPTSLVLHADQAGPTINRDIFSQFSEMLGNGVYGGIWVGKDSRIPNVRGIRSDVVAALREIRVPVVRWPGGCFGDKYNWRDGVGPANARTSTVNMWGNVVEPNTFGSDEYMDFLQQIGSEAYISVNVGSRPAGDAAEWLEYLTTDQPSTLGRMRAANGHAAPYRVKYLGIGNESWGCGGGMSGEQYVAEYKRYATFASNLNPAQNGPVKFVRSKDAMQYIAVGPDSDKPEYTEAVMKAWTQKPVYGWDISGLSLHYYSGGSKGVLASPSSGFGEDEYAAALKSTLQMEQLIRQHSAIMDKYDPAKKVGLMIDEWGLWAAPIAGTNFMFMKQNGSLRDAVVAAVNLNMFARHADRVRMANIAQMVNVIHSLILTEGPKMVRTPTYHVYRMYLPFRDAQLLPVELTPGTYRVGAISLPQVDAVAARSRDGKVWLALTNLDANQASHITIRVPGVVAASAKGQSLTADRVDTINSFERPDAVVPRPLAVGIHAGVLTIHLPPKSVNVVELGE